MFYILDHFVNVKEIQARLNFFPKFSPRIFQLYRKIERTTNEHVHIHCLVSIINFCCIYFTTYVHLIISLSFLILFIPK